MNHEACPLVKGLEEVVLGSWKASESGPAVRMPGLVEELFALKRDVKIGNRVIFSVAGLIGLQFAGVAPADAAKLVVHIFSAVWPP